MKRRRKLIACLIAPFLGLLLAEGVVRVLGRRPVPLPEVKGGVLHKVRGDLVFINRPNARKVLLYRDHPGAKPRRVEMRTNGNRFRGPEVEQVKPEGTLRIACLGDSHTFGDGVEEGQTWPDHLRERLVGDQAVEVLNCGVNAYDTMQEALWFEKHVLPFDPDVCVLAYFVNDVAARGIDDDSSKPDWLQRVVHPRQTEPWIKNLRGTSRAADLLCDAIYRRREKAGYTSLLWERYADDSQGWLLVQQGLMRLRDRCEAEGIAFHVTLFPYIEATGDGFQSDRALAKVREFAASIDLEIFDASPSMFAAWEGENLRVSTQDYHANGHAHGLFANAVAGELERLGYPFAPR